MSANIVKGKRRKKEVELFFSSEPHPIFYKRELIYSEIKFFVLFNK